MSTGMNSNTCKLFPCPPELNQACRRLLSPSKRKSDDENEFGCCSISPVKSPRSSPDDVSPVKSFNHSRNASSPSLNLADQTTPKSCSRLNSKRGSRGLWNLIMKTFQFYYCFQLMLHSCLDFKKNDKKLVFTKILWKSANSIFNTEFLIYHITVHYVKVYLFSLLQRNDTN